MKKPWRLAFLLVALAVSNGSTAQSLRTIQVQEREVARRYSIDGVVEATRQSTVSAQISGRVKALNFDVGDRVSKGQIILRIDESEANQAVAGSNAQLAQAQAVLSNARLNYERSRQLFEQKFISQAALDKAKADFEMAEAQAQSSAAGARQSALAQSYTAVVAPYAGVVSARMVEMGEMVTVGKPLMTGFDPAELRIIVNVPQYKLAAIGAKPNVSIEVPQLKRWLNPAGVMVQPSADPRTHSTPVRINLASNEQGVYPGMFVRAHFVVGKETRLTIPLSAVVKRSEVVAVYVVDTDDVPRLRQVRLGETAADGEVEVLAGLQAGERIALEPVQAGMAVKK
ncbi:MAG: efflux RND transporter periplasmic adaptor subunit [Sideroxyarcus sp.]|nr:efflux RND transporter periplasmic adaptor subunit [Sideroxyarcus sp.]